MEASQPTDELMDGEITNSKLLNQIRNRIIDRGHYLPHGGILFPYEPTKVIRWFCPCQDSFSNHSLDLAKPMI